jgi:hypothetical protein
MGFQKYHSLEQGNIKDNIQTPSQIINFPHRPSLWSIFRSASTGGGLWNEKSPSKLYPCRHWCLRVLHSLDGEDFILPPPAAFWGSGGSRMEPRQHRQACTTNLAFRVSQPVQCCRTLLARRSLVDLLSTAHRAPCPHETLLCSISLVLASPRLENGGDGSARLRFRSRVFARFGLESFSSAAG